MDKFPQTYEFNLDLDSLTTSEVNWFTISNIVQGSGRYVCQTRCPSDYGHVEFILSAYQGATQVLLEWKVTEEVIPAEFISSVIHGVKLAAARENRIIVNIKIQVIGGSYHPVDSRQYSYITAAIRAFEDAISQATLIHYESVR